MTKWEYKIEYDLNIGQLDNFGEKGRELIIVIPTSTTLKYYFKRRIEETKAWLGGMR